MKKILLLSMAFASLAANAQDVFTIAPFTFTQTSATTVEVSKVDTKDANGVLVDNYVVPSTVENGGVTYTVSAIGKDAFKWKTVSSVTLPETIDTLKYGAFNTVSGLTQLTLPKSLKYIGEYCFSSSKLTSIEIPEGVTKIDNSAFFSSQQLASITLPQSLESIGKSCFYNCGFSEIALPEKIDSIPYSLFQKCKNLEKVTMSSNVYTIGQWAFLGCSKLTSIQLPSVVKYIGYQAFCNSGLTSFTMPASCEEVGGSFISNAPTTTLAVESGNKAFTLRDGAIYSKDTKVLYAVPAVGVKTFNVKSGCIGIFNGAFSGSEVEEVKLPSGMLAIDDFAFCESKLTKISFPSSVVMVGEQAFAGTQLTEVTLPENAPLVDDAAFAQCPKLTKVTIPSGVKQIAVRAFTGCKAITSVTCLGSTAPVLEDIYESYEGQFYGVASSTPLYVPKGTSQSYKDAGWNSYFTITEADKGVLSVVSTTPADGAEVSSRYMNMTFDVEFNEDFSIVKSNPEAYIRVGGLVSGEVVEPDDSWVALRAKANLLRIWGSDWDGYTCYISMKTDTDYYMVIPAGVVKNTAGETNEQIVIKFSYPSVPSGIDNAETSADAKVVGTYNINGQKVDAGVKGITIRKMSDGSVKKVLVR